MTPYEPGFGPGGISFEDAYTAIRTWCRDNVDGIETATGLSARSRALIAALPEPADASDLEMRAVFAEVIGGNLEWAYRKTDGRHRMAEYAHGALDGAGITFEISDPDEREQLRASLLWPHLFCTRYW